MEFRPESYIQQPANSKVLIHYGVICSKRSRTHNLDHGIQILDPYSQSSPPKIKIKGFRLHSYNNNHIKYAGAI